MLDRLEPYAVEELDAAVAELRAGLGAATVAEGRLTPRDARARAGGGMREPTAPAGLPLDAQLAACVAALLELEPGELPADTLNLQGRLAAGQPAADRGRR